MMTFILLFIGLIIFDLILILGVITVSSHCSREEETHQNSNITVSSNCNYEEETHQS